MFQGNKTAVAAFLALFLTSTGGNLTVSSEINEIEKNIERMNEYFTGYIEQSKYDREQQKEVLRLLKGEFQQHLVEENLSGTSCITCHIDNNSLPKKHLKFTYFKDFVTCEDRWYKVDMPCYNELTDVELYELYGLIYLYREKE